MEFSRRSPTTEGAEVKVDVVDWELFTLVTQLFEEGCMAVPCND